MCYSAVDVGHHSRLRQIHRIQMYRPFQSVRVCTEAQNESVVCQLAILCFCLYQVSMPYLIAFEPTSRVAQLLPAKPLRTLYNPDRLYLDPQPKFPPGLLRPFPPIIRVVRH